MENQHRAIQTYRELDQNEIDLMNECKSLEAQVLALQERLYGRAVAERDVAKDSLNYTADAVGAHEAIASAEQAIRAASIAKTEIQTGFMWLTRSVARPSEPKLVKNSSDT